MDLQKYVNNAFFALMSGLASYAVAQLERIDHKMSAIEQATYQLHSRTEVQKEINENIDFNIKDIEARLRFQERCTKCGG